MKTEEDLQVYLNSIFGKDAKDKITGFMGKITGTAFYPGGSQRVGISTSFDGKYHEEWFDADRVEIIET